MDHKTQAEPPRGNYALLWLGGIVALVVMIAQCSTQTATPTTSIPPTAPTLVATDAALLPPMTDQAINDIKAGTRAFAKAAAVDDATAAVVFSKNCYAALDSRFTWPKLDQCGAFDAAAASDVLSERMSGDVAETDYLSEENAAQRFLLAGNSHGADASAMDVRWDKTKRDAERLEKLSRPKPKPTPTATSSDDENYDVDENGNLTPDTGD